MKPEPYSGFLLAFNSCRPTSRGSVSIVSPELTDAPQIRPNYLGTVHDEEEVIQGSRLVRRIMEARPPVVVTMDQPLAPWNLDSERVVAAALSRDYALVASEPREGAHLLVYLRRDRRREPR